MPRPRRHTRPFSPRQGASHERPSPHRLFSRRLTALTAFFVAVCLVYGGILISLQARGNAYSIYVPGTDVPDGGTLQRVTVQAMRGEIYDRDGTPLVTNRYSYDLCLDHTAFTTSGSVDARCDILLSLAAALFEYDTSLTAQEVFPLEGTYPRLSYTEAAMTEGSTQHAALLRVLSELSLSENTSAQALVEYFVDKYALDAQLDGIPRYSAEQITLLLCLYYDMINDRFGSLTPYTLAHDVPASLISAQKENNTPGVRFTVQTERVYHYPGYASHLLGRVGQIFAEDWAYYNAMGYPMNATVGVSGCESAFENILHGTDGEMEIVVDASGAVLSRTMLTQPIAGHDIYLTIDIDAQIAAEDALRAAIEQSASSQSGAVVVTEADTGRYLVIASAPSYDISDFIENYTVLAADEHLPLLNRALSATYTPGALMHVTSTVAGLSEGVVSLSTMWQDSDALTVQNQTLHCSLSAKTGNHHGTLGIGTALRDGCDVFFGQLGLALGGDRFETWEKRLGIGEKTGLELGESAGSLSHVVPSTDAMMMRAAAGYSDAGMTPAQMCSMLSTVLTGGVRYGGHVLSEARSFTSGEVVYRKGDEALSQASIIEDHRLVVLRAMKNKVLTSAVLSGATEGLRESGVSVGALSATVPSGTVQTDHAMLLMYGMPNEANARGAVSVAVVVENGTVWEAAAPVGCAVLEEIFK